MRLLHRPPFPPTRPPARPCAQFWPEADPSALLASPRLWQRLPGRRALLLSVDALLLRASLDEWVQYEYVAAPACPEADA